LVCAGAYQLGIDNDRGVPIVGPDLGSRKARMLLKLLAVERPRTVPADRIAAVLRGDAPPAAPAENIATFVSPLRRERPDHHLRLPA